MWNTMAVTISSQKTLERYHGIDKITKIIFIFP
jgi:hypothetical protein